jgi:hypothetical protein
MEWRLQPGDRIWRKDLHDLYGGRRQGGIGPSTKSPNVFVFTDAASGEEHGYRDRWESADSLLYTGEGQVGDQQMKQGNAAILHHQAQGRALRVFQGARGNIEYVGQFVVDETNPWKFAQAPETGGGPLRRVIVFRLHRSD